MDRITAHSSRHLLHEQLEHILEMLTRVLPADDQQEQDIEKVAEFAHTRHAVIEAEHAGICSLPIDPKHWRFDGVIPSAHTAPSSRRWFLRRMTQHGSVWDDSIITCPPPTHATGLTPPPGMRLWHETEGVRKALLLTKYDLEELFKSVSEEEGICMPHTQDSHAYGGGVTILVTPRRVLGFKDGMRLLSDKCTYIHKTCLEYAKMLCYLYSLTMEEFSTLTRMSITRRLGGTPIALQTCGGGLYDNGPWASAQIGVAHVSHDWSPTLMPHTHSPHLQTPVRVRVAEGTLMVADGFARTCYGHGYTHEPRADRKRSPYYYTIDFFMDSMRDSGLVGRAPLTGDMIMYTPVTPQHVVERAPTPREGGATTMGSLDPLLELVRVIRARLQTAESSHLLRHVGPSMIPRGP